MDDVSQNLDLLCLFFIQTGLQKEKAGFTWFKKQTEVKSVTTEVMGWQLGKNGRENSEEVLGPAEF